MSAMCSNESVKTFQTEDAFSKSIHNILQRSLIGHIKEVLVIWVAGNVLDFTEEGLGVDSSTVVVAEDLCTVDEITGSFSAYIKYLSINNFVLNLKLGWHMGERLALKPLRFRQTSNSLFFQHRLVNTLVSVVVKTSPVPTLRHVGAHNPDSRGPSQVAGQHG